MILHLMLQKLLNRLVAQEKNAKIKNIRKKHIDIKITIMYSNLFFIYNIYNIYNI